jgi:hypothetical protein
MGVGRFYGNQYSSTLVDVPEICDRIALLLVSWLSMCLLKRDFSPIPTPIERDRTRSGSHPFSCEWGMVRINNTGWPEGNTNELQIPPTLRYYMARSESNERLLYMIQDLKNPNSVRLSA